MARVPFVRSPDDNENATPCLPGLHLDGGPHLIHMAADALIVNF